MSVNSTSSNPTPIAVSSDEHIAPKTVSDQGSSPFDTIPDEILQIILEPLPQMQLNRAGIGPNRVSKRFNKASKDAFKKKSLKSPPRKSHLHTAELLRAPMKKRRPSNFPRKVIPFNLDT